MTRVVVVGGGVIGAAAAWALAERGAAVVLIEQYEPGHDRGASHGSARIFRLAYDEADYVSLAQQAHDGWRRLEAVTGTDLLRITGAVDHGDPAQLAALAVQLAAAGAEHLLLGPVEATGRWPGLRFAGEVLWHAEAGRVHADRAVAALQQAAAARGAELRHRTPVVEVDPDGTGVTVAGGIRLEADAVVVAAGGWSRHLLAARAPLPPMRVTLEQPAHFAARDSSTQWPSFIHHPTPADPVGPGGAAAYGLASEDGIKVGFHKIGPAIDPDVDDRAIDEAALATLRAYVAEWVPGVEPASAVPETCTYTLTPDEHFLVDRVGSLTVLAGFSGHGFKFAPAIGALAADLVLDGAAPPARFRFGRRNGAEPPPVIR